MGRYISFYIVDKDQEHKQDNGQICLGLEYQPDHKDLVDMLVCHLNNHSMCDQERRNYIEYEYLCNSAKQKVCQKCKMFMVGIQCAIVKDNLHIHHSYSNPIWDSNYSIQDMSLGSSTTSFVNLFRNNMQYYEIFESDVRRAYTYLEQLGTPKRTSDKEAYDETKHVLHFLEKWIDNGSVYVIMEVDM